MINPGRRLRRYSVSLSAEVEWRATGDGALLLCRVDGQLEHLVAEAAGIAWARRACACWSGRAWLAGALYNRRAG